MKYLVSFVIALVLFSVLFLGLDYGMMKLQGLTLIFTP